MERVSIDYDPETTVSTVCVLDAFGLRDEIAWFLDRAHAFDFANYIMNEGKYVGSTDKAREGEGAAQETEERKIPLGSGRKTTSSGE